MIVREITLIHAKREGEKKIYCLTKLTTSVNRDEET